MNYDKEIIDLEKEIISIEENLDEYYKSEFGSSEEEPEYPEDHGYSEIDEAIDILNEKKAKLQKLSHKKEEEERLEILKKNSTYEGYIIKDSETTVDFLSRKQQALEISKLIANKKTLSPLTIGINGAWGQGKSTFLRLIESDLKELNIRRKENKEIENQYGQSYIVKFNASEYNDQEKIWYSMLSQLFSTYENEVKYFAKLKYGISAVKKSVKENPSYYIVNMAIMIIFVLWIYFFTYNKSIIDVFKENDLWQILVGVVSTVAVSVNIIGPLLKKIILLKQPMSIKIVEQLKYPDFKEKLGSREQVKEILDLLTSTWIKNDEDKIIVMVDELDRCTEQTIVEFFDALLLFLSSNSIVYVITINEESVYYALANNNKHFFEEEVISNFRKFEFGKKYLEKYITVPIILPSKNNYRNYIDNIISKNYEGDKKIFTSSEKDLLLELIQEINDSIEITPRDVKKVINLLIVYKGKLMNLNKDTNTKEKLKFDEFIVWFLIKYFYSELAERILIRVANKKNKIDKFKSIKSEFHPEINIAIIKKLEEIKIMYILISNDIMNK